MATKSEKCSILAIIWILGSYRGSLSQECRRRPPKSSGNHNVAQLAFDDTNSDSDGRYFTIYNTKSMMSELNVQSRNFDIDTVLGAIDNNADSMLSTSIDTTCSIAVSRPNCLQFGFNHDQRRAGPEAFVSMFQVQNTSDNDIEPVQGTNLDSICNCGGFKLYKGKSDEDSYQEIVADFCTLVPQAKLNVHVAEHNMMLYLAYEIGSDYKPGMATAFAVPLTTDHPVTVRCGVPMPRLEMIPDTTASPRLEPQILSDVQDVVSIEMVALIAVVGVVVVTLVIAVPLVIICFRRRKAAKQPGIQITPASQDQPYEHISPVVNPPAPASYLDLLTPYASIDGSLYHEISDDGTASTLDINQSNESAVTTHAPNSVHTISRNDTYGHRNSSNSGYISHDRRDSEISDKHTYIVLISDDGVIHSKPSEVNHPNDLVETPIYERNPKTPNVYNYARVNPHSRNY